MPLRSHNSSSRGARRRLRLALVAAFAAVAALAASSGAGVSDYPTTLYLDGPASGIATGSYQLQTVAPQAPFPAQPTVSTVAGGSLPNLTSFTYIVVVLDGSGGMSASLASLSGTPSNPNSTVRVANLPANSTIAIYRQTSGAGPYQLVKPAYATGAAPVTWDDDGSATPGASLPMAANRVAGGVFPAAGPTGYVDFTPGYIPATTGTNDAVSAAPTAPATCKGWIVDAGGAVSFPTQNWTFTARVKGASGSGTARLAAGMWKTNATGSIVGGAIVDPATTENGATDIARVGNNYTTVTVTANNVGTFSLSPYQHLCVQFWRHQTVGYAASASVANRLITMAAYDSTGSPNFAKIGHSAVANALPSIPSPVSPADGVSVASLPTLSASYADGEADNGTVNFRVCSDNPCTAQVDSGSSASVASGANGSWQVGAALTDRTYYWQARAQDTYAATGGVYSDWSAVRSFTLDTTPPTMTISSKPSNPSNTADPSFSFSANESVTGYECALDGGPFSACASPASYTGLSDASHTFQVKATADTVGNLGSATSYTWTVDTAAPNTTITAAPADPSASSNASISFTSTEGGTFKCALDGGAFGVCTSPVSYSSLADGSHTLAVEAIDAAGNTDPSPASTTWTVDTTAPVTTIDAKPSSPSNDTAPSFSFSANEAVTGFQCSLDGAAFAACTSAKSYSGLADGSHTFQVKATADTAGNAGSAAPYTWTVDTAPPDTSITSSPSNPSASSNPSFSFTGTEPGTFKCSVDGAAFALCASGDTYLGLADGAHTFRVEAVDVAGNADVTPASASWTIDTTAPDTTIGPTKPPALSTAATATFDFAATEVGSTFACALDGAAFAACTTPQGYAGLAEGSHTFQVRATDPVGNTDGSPATYSWTVDTSVPTATPTVPAAGTSVKKSSTFSAIFGDSPGDTGTVDFRICADPACIFVFASGTSASVGTGGTATWAWTAYLSGYYYWAVRARDAAGNTSLWTAARQVRVDAFAPSAPPRFAGTVTNGVLVLSWQAPTDDVGAYVVYVSGQPWRTVDGTTRSVTIGSFDASDTRRFTVRAIDLAGNVGAESPALVGVPNVVGLTVTQAADAAAARGLLLKNQRLGFASGAGVVMAQSPAAPAVATEGSTIQVLLAPANGASTPLVQVIHPIRITCSDGSRQLQLQVALSRRASVKWSLLAVRRIARGTFGSLPAGTSRVTVDFPRRARAGRYRLVVTARSQGEQVQSTVRVALTSRAPEIAASCGQ